MEEICADVQLSVEATPTGDYVAKVQSSSLFSFFSDVSSEEVASKYMLNNVQAAGVQPGMPWSAFPEISTEAQRVLESTYSTKAFIELHYVPETFDKLFNMDKKFARLPIFRKDGSVFVQLASKTARYPYIAIHNAGMERLQDNRKWRTRNVQTGNKPDIARFFNMAFVSETKSDRYVCQKTGEEIRYSQVDGFFPYFSNRSDKLKEIMFYFHHKVNFYYYHHVLRQHNLTAAAQDLKRVVLVTAPIDEREEAIGFLRAHGTIHAFDKLCAMCGKTGDLLKCKCKRVRYCGKECQMRHWAVHKVGCRE